MSTIPASQLVTVNPSVINAGGTGLDVNGLVLTNGTRVPIGTVQSFASAAAVAAYFGSGSAEATIAGGGTNLGTGYFGGFDGSTKKPGALLFAQYNQAAVSAYLRGGPGIASLTLAQLQAITGTLIVVIDGYTWTAGSLNLSAATSLSSAASIIQTALNASPATQASVTGSITATTLTVTAVGSGTLAVGQRLSGSGVTSGTTITALGTGTGGTGTYTVSPTQTASSTTITATGTPVIVTYDSTAAAFVITSGITGTPSTAAFATGTTAATLKLTSATGAVLSQGAAAAVPAAFMNALVGINSNWVCFMTSFDPDGGSGNTVKQAFAAWKTTQNNRFAYVCWDTDITPTATVPATSSLGYILANNSDSGTVLIYEATDLNLASFFMGAAASIDFTKKNGRISFAYKAQSGLVASVSDGTIATNLGGNPQVANSLGNGYNFYGAYGAANQNFTWFQRGLITGTFAWADSYINQVWLNNSFQVALLNLQKNSLSIPYTVDGSSLINAALADPIAAGLNFGAFGPGTLSAAQIAQVTSQSGNANVAQSLQTQGYYLQVLPAVAATRASRTSPPCTFWYIDQGSVQAITLASVELQ